MAACKVCRNEYNRKKSAEIGHDVLYQRAKSKDPEAHKKRAQEYYKNNMASAVKRVAESRLKNPEETKIKRQAEYEKYKERALENARRWAKENPEKRKEVARDYAKRFYSNPENKPVLAARKLVSRITSLTGNRSQGRTEKALGYSVAEFRAHIERNFLDGMSWDNHGEWHIDHIIPVSEMVALGITCPKKINALKNLIPVWACDNLSKGNRFELSQVAI
jgi:hypothetical protein